jgi:serine/threonine-protein kinase HipA
MLAQPGVRVARTGLPPWFENLLPEEGGALRRLICKPLGLRAGDSASLLVALGKDLPGAVEVTGSTIEATGETSVDAHDDQRLGPALRISLAGLQLKFSMSMDGDRLVLPAKGQRDGGS